MIAAELERALQRAARRTCCRRAARAPRAMRDVGAPQRCRRALDQRVRRRLDPDDPGVVARNARRRTSSSRVMSTKVAPPTRATSRTSASQHRWRCRGRCRGGGDVTWTQPVGQAPERPRCHGGEARAERGGQRRQFLGQRARPRGRFGSRLRLQRGRRSHAESRQRRARRSSRGADRLATAPVDGSTPRPAWTASVSEAKGLGGLHVDATIPCPARTRAGADPRALTRRRVVACRKVLLVAGDDEKIGVVFHRASGFAIAPGEWPACGCPASAHRPAATQRRGCGPAGLACAHRVFHRNC